MDITHERAVAHERPTAQERKTAKAVSSGSIGEGLTGGAAVALAIIALADIYPLFLTSIAAIAIGAGLLLHGGAISARTRHLLSELSDRRVDTGELGGGLSAEFAGGIAGITLGVLALIGIIPVTLLSIAAIVFGATLLISSSAIARLNDAAIAMSDQYGGGQSVARASVSSAAGLQTIAGLGAITLGILALIGIAPMMLVMVSMLVVGGANLLSGTAVSSRFMSLFGG